MGLGSFFSAVLAKIGAVVVWLGSFGVAVFVALWDIGKDGFCWCFDAVLKLSTGIISSLDVSGFATFTASGWGALPGELVNILGLLGVGTAITIIASALGIRMALQLIPFVRLGS